MVRTGPNNFRTRTRLVRIPVRSDNAGANKHHPAFLSGGVAPFEETQAAQAAFLYNATGRVRQFRVDAMIAGTAIVGGGPLATSNRKDSQRLIPYGLTLISAP